MNNHLKKMLDDYAISTFQQGYWKAKSEQGVNLNSGETEKNFALANEQRSEIEALFSPYVHIANLKSVLKDLIESIQTIETILKTDTENLRNHNKDNEAVFLLENYREHLRHLADKYIKKMID